MSTHKEIYEALQAVNACLDATGEQLLVDLVEKIRTELRRERRIHAGHPAWVDATLRTWIEVDAAEPAEELPVSGPWSHGRLPA
jgi:hypothetical protein